MNLSTIEIFLELTGVAVCERKPTEALQQACTAEALEAAYVLAAHHDLAHLVGQGAAKLQLADSPSLQKCKKVAMRALVRQTRQEIAFQSICRVLEQGQIPFIPLKGSVLRQWYPETWMRTSCDIDILIREEDLPRAQTGLEGANWSFQSQTSHDWCFVSAEQVHLELHYSTIEDYVSDKGKKIMDGIWQDARPVAGKQYHMEISDGLFYYYHMAHMAKHFVHGGCGVRSFLYVWVLNHRVDFSTGQREQFLEMGGLTAFARAAEKLSEIWFSGEPMDEMSQRLQAFVLSGGTYGTVENRVSLQQGKEGGKLRFALKRIFLPYEILKYDFPVLQKHKWLTPVFHVVRWLRLLFCGGVKRSVSELQTVAEVSEEKRKEIGMLLRYLEL